MNAAKATIKATIFLLFFVCFMWLWLIVGLFVFGCGGRVRFWLV
jgi:hypothetical protein